MSVSKRSNKKFFCYYLLDLLLLFFVYVFVVVVFVYFFIENIFQVFFNEIPSRKFISAREQNV